MVKICSKCKTSKSLDSFAKHLGGIRSACKECANRQERAAYKTSPEKRMRAIALSSATQEMERKNSPEKYRERYLSRDLVPVRRANRAWYARNIEKQRIRTKTWGRLNRALIRQTAGRRRTAKILATPSWLTPIQNAQIQEMYDIAEARDTQTGIKHHVDHIVALRGKGFSGLHVPWNLQILTAKKNIAKKNKPPTEYAHLFWKVAA